MKYVSHSVRNELLKRMIIHPEQLKLVRQVAQFILFELCKNNVAFHYLV